MDSKYLNSGIGDHLRSHHLNCKPLKEWLLPLRPGCFRVEWFPNPLAVDGCLVPVHS